MKPKRFISGFFPMNRCNLKCEYCYISHLPEYYKSNAEEPLFTPEQIARSLRPERLGGICLINLTGEGETLLQPDIVEISRLLLEEGHFLEIVTNLTITKVLKSLLQFSAELQKRLTFKFSFLYLELKKRGLLSQFWENVQLVQASKCSFSLELMSSDTQIEYIPEIIDECIKQVGAKCHVTVGRSDNTKGKELLTKLSMEQYEEKWSIFDSGLFRFKMDILGIKRKEYCYAGKWTIFLNMHTGEARSCYAQPDSQKIFDDPNKPISFHAVGHNCVQPYCFNGHSFLTLGVIPELETPTYYEMRNRLRADRTNWFSDETKECYSTKLVETNKTDSRVEKCSNVIAWYLRAIKYAITHIDKVSGYLKKRLWSRG